eukprot:8883676-Prorocentrum_lima.AAC.1
MSPNGSGERGRHPDDWPEVEVVGHDGVDAEGQAAHAHAPPPPKHQPAEDRLRGREPTASH